MKRRRARFDVESWVEDNLEVVRREHGAGGHAELVCRCEACGKARLYINGRTGAWICFACNADGDSRGGIRSLVMRHGGLSDVRADRLVRAGYATRPKVLRRRVDALGKRHIPPPPCSLPECTVLVLPGRASRYLTSRGVPPAVQIEYGTGYCPKGRYARRVVLPVRMHGELRGFQARAVDPDTEPRYLTQRSGTGTLVHGLDEAAARSPGWTALVEGPIKVLRLAAFGVVAVACLGKSVRPSHAAHLSQSGMRSVILMLDPDARAQQRRAAGVLRGLGLRAKEALLDVAPDDDPQVAAEVFFSLTRDGR